MRAVIIIAAYVVAADAAQSIGTTPGGHSFDMSHILAEYGLIAALLGFFVWQSWLRENRLANRVTALESFVEHKLLKTLTQASEGMKASAGALRENTAALATQQAALTNLVEELRRRPCMLEEQDHLESIVEKAMVRFMKRKAETATAGTNHKEG